MLRIAFKFIKFDKAKSIGVITAIVISIFLIGQQLSLLIFLMGLMGNLIGNAPVKDNQLWIIEGQSKNINIVNSIDQRLVYQIGSLPDVKAAYPVVLASARVSFLDGKTATVTLVGADATQFIMGPVPEKIVEGNLSSLTNPNTLSAEIYSAKSWDTQLSLDKAVEINGKAARIGLLTKNAQAFGASLMYTSLENVRTLGNVSPYEVSVIIVDLKPTTDKEQAISAIHRLFPHLRAWDARALQKSTVKEILITSNMGMSFGTLVIFAIVSGFFIIGLTLYSSALDRLKDYGTLKAIGATSSYVNKLIIMQAFLYALFGYAIAMLFLFGFKLGVKNAGLIIDLSITFCLFLLAVTLFISIGGSLFAVRKISKLEPASVF
ncbi:MULTISPECIES: ABC transporter permease [Sphingobacterium]|uniref:ABC transporter permease n=1 Tax=Sphingobacterium TaxID=28453 RepID=UPI0013D9E079|nr:MULTISPECIES: FtsX-like permease family protein [unclassified Sphingobacterium]